MVYPLRIRLSVLYLCGMIIQIMFLMVPLARTDDALSLDNINNAYLNLQYSSPSWHTLKYSWNLDHFRELKIRQLVLEINRNEIEAALQLFHELHDYSNYYLIYSIINQAYASDTKNTFKLVNFFTKLPWCNHQYAGFEFLFGELKFNNHLRTSESIQFAYQLKKFLDGIPVCNHVNDDIYIIARTKNLINSFPTGIKLIIWQNSKLCIKSNKYNEHIYAAGCCEYDDKRRRVFTWVPKGPIGTQGEWTFESINGGNLFRIKSDKYNEYLYAADCCKYDDKRRNVFTWIPKDDDIGTHGEWTLELVNENNLFRIRNNRYDEYLYAANCCFYDDDRRSLFTWLPKDDIGSQGEFEISPC